MRTPWAHAALQVPVVSKHCSGRSGRKTNAVAGTNYFQPVVRAGLQFGSSLQRATSQFLFADRRKCYIPCVGICCFPLSARMRDARRNQFPVHSELVWGQPPALGVRRPMTICLASRRFPHMPRSRSWRLTGSNICYIGPGLFSFQLFQ